MTKKNKEHHQKNKWRKWTNNYIKFVIVLVVLLFVFILAFICDEKSVKIDYSEENQDISSTINNENYYDAIITILDGEGEDSFTKTWGDLLKEGYPVCSNLVISNVGKSGYMNWETIEALNNIGVEFVFHTCSYDKNYDYHLMDDVISSIESGIAKMDEHNLEHRIVTWTSGINKEIYSIGNEYFEAGFSNSNSTNTVIGETGNCLNIQYRSNASNYSYGQLVDLINAAKKNNGWIVLFTRNNSENMTNTQINEFRKAFEYAKEHNVGIVTASEGFDLYYGNKLGNK